MSRFGSRTLSAAGAGALAVALAVAGGVPAGAVPSSGQVDSMQDLKGAWLTSLAGFQEGQPVNWQHRLTVRKVKGSAAVAWEEWRNCADHAAECKAGKVTGDGWTAPSRVLLAMDAKGVVHGIGATGTLMVTPGEDGMTAVMLSAGQPEEDVVQVPTTSALSPTAPRLTSEKWYPDYGYAGYGSMVRCPDHG